MLNQYLKDLYEASKHGDATEQSYYPDLQRLVSFWAEKNIKRVFTVTPLPKKTEAGNPDFRVWDGKQSIVGYIEAKVPGTDLDHIQSSPQLKRYRETFPNLILTDFCEFRLFRNGELIDKVAIARPFIMTELKTAPPVEKAHEFDELLSKFFSFSRPRRYTAKTLAVELARLTRFLRDEIVTEELVKEEGEKKGNLYGFYEAFKQYLISSLTRQDFADLYSQTITYGLFAARMRADGEFNRKSAVQYIPHTIGVLRDVFQFVSLGDIPPSMEWIVDDISEVLSVADPKQLMHKFYQEGKGKDPVVHFYETFLAEYDPKEREKRGVYYTPEPVVSYIVRSVHQILQDRFGKVDGLADSSVTVLDPAAGTLTFLAEAAKLAVKEFTEKYGDGAKAGFIKDHVLRDFYAFELMMAPYAVGHLKMSFLLEELGYRLQEDDRFKLYLTNTLEMEELPETTLPGVSSLSEESHLAAKVKNEQPILVIIGNPPYSGHSTNIGKWISKEIKDYYQVDGKPLGEKNPKWLQDDYVKFIRFAQWKIDQAGEGVVGLITNHGYLDNPTFRGMRQSLMKSFDEIYVLDLHGNSLKKEVSPDGSPDENVFDVRQGVAVCLFIKRKGKVTGHEVNHADFWGARERKYDLLEASDIKTTKWKELKPKSEFYLFVTRDERMDELYGSFLKITDIFPVNSVGIVTARDRLTVKWSENEIWNTVLQFSKMDTEMARQTYRLGKDAKDWKVEWAQKDIKDSGPDRSKIAPILYRPFDTRYTYYTGKSSGFQCRPRPEVMRHMLQDNIGLITARSNKSSHMDHFFCTDTIMETKCGESTTQSAVFPLYIYPDTDKEDLFSQIESQEKKPNLDPNLVKQLREQFKKEISPEEIFYYIYAVLYAPVYRTKYAEFLRIDFPRVPFTRDYKLFKKLGELGKRLADLHLMKSKELDKPVAQFKGKGDNRIEKLRYDETSQAVYISSSQYFVPISPELYDYQIGGYQVLNKWLKDRKGRELSAEDTRHYCRIATALAKTIDIQQDIDKLYPQVEDSLMKLGLEI